MCLYCFILKYYYFSGGLLLFPRIEYIEMNANKSSNRLNSHIPRIKLSSVSSHFLKKTEKSPYRSTNVLASSYDKVFFLTATHNDYNLCVKQQEYEQVLSILQEMKGRAVAFQGMKELQSRQIFKGKRRYLVLTSTNQRSMRILEAIRKKNCKSVDIVILGQLKPSSELLSDVVKLATDNAEQVLKFMSENGLETPEIKTYLAHRSNEAKRMSDLQSNFMRTLRESSESSSQRTTGMMNRLSIKRPEHHWIVDKDGSTNKFTTTEIINPLANNQVNNNKQELRSSESQQSDKSRQKITIQQKEQQLNLPKQKQVPTTTAQYGVRDYENEYVNYQPQPRVIRKEITLPEEVRPISQKNTAFQNKAIYQPITYPTQQHTTLNYRAINSNRVSQMLQTNPSQIPTSPVIHPKTVNIMNVPSSPQSHFLPTRIDLDEYQRIQLSGTIIYRKKPQ